MPASFFTRLGNASQHFLRRMWGRPHADGYARLPPEWLILGINNTCNLHCKMCDVGLGESGTVFWANLIGRDPRNMSLDLLHHILQQARAFWPRPKIGLAFTEPLIHPQIVDFVRAITAQGLFSALTSNGTQLPRLAEALVVAGLGDLTLSVDGPPAVHNRIRGGHETFEKMYRGVEALNAAKARLNRPNPTVRFSFTVTDENCGQIVDFVRAIAPLQGDHIIISHLNFINEAMAAAHNARYTDDLTVTRSNLGTMDPAVFPVDTITEQLLAVQAYARTTQPRPLSLTFVPPLPTPERVTHYYQNPLLPVGGRQCTDPWAMMMIKPDGMVIPAHGRCYNYPVGNVRETPLTELWNNARFRQFRQTLQAAGGTLPACLRCCGVVGKP